MSDADPREHHYRRLERMYLVSAPINKFFQPRLHIEHHRARVEIDVREELFHAAGAVHGSVYFKALDDAAFFAANSEVEDVFVLTTSFTTYLTRPVSQGTMIATGSLVNFNHSQLIAEAVLTDDRDRELGRASGVFVRSRIPLNEEIGYR